MSLQPLVALDLGSTKVACAIGLPHESRAGFELLGTGVVAYPSLTESWLNDPLMVGQTIERALETAGVRDEVQRALVAITQPELVSHQVHVGITLADEPITVRARDLDRLQAAALHQVLGIDREPLVVERLGCSGNGFDGVQDPRGLAATRLLGAFHIITMPMTTRRAVTQAVESAGLDVAQVSYTLPAALASLTDEALSHRRVVVVDAGGLTTDLGYFVEGLLQTMTIVPVGGLRLATTIAKDLRVTMEQAVTWSLEGTTCRREEVRTLIAASWDALRAGIEAILTGQPKPDALVVSGRAALIDGFVEWLERSTGIPTTLCRSPRTNRLADVEQQVGMSASLGLLELATRAANPLEVPTSSGVFDRLLGRTRAILTEYF